MLGKRIINTGGVSCTTDTTQILDAGTTESLALYRFEDNAFDTSNSTGYINKGALFNGSNSKISLTAGSFTYTGEFSIAAWIKLSSSQSSQVILENYDYVSSTSRGFVFRVMTGEKLKFDGYYSDATRTDARSNESIPLGVWTHVTAVYNPTSSSIKLYINGSEVTYHTQTYNTMQYHSGCTVNIGCLSYTGGNDEQFFHGNIDELRVYGDALTATEVGYIANNTTASIPTSNLNAFYSFEGNANDSTSSPINGTASNVVYDYDGTANNITYSTGKFGKAGVFNGSSTAIELPNLSTMFGQKTSYTVSAWFKAPSSAMGNRAIFDDYNYANSNLGLYLYDGVMNFFARYNNSNTSGIYSGTVTYNDNNWHHVVATSDQTTGKLYIDGQLISSGAMPSPSYSGGSPVPSIGKQQHPGSSTYSWFDGSIDQVRIFDHAITAAQVTALYNETATSAASTTIDNPSTLAYYKMADATDETGSYNGTATNVDFNVQGKYGFAGKFNGSSSKIVLPSGEPFGNSDTIKSISVWVKANTTTSRIHFFSVSGNDAYDWFSARYDGNANNISVYRRKDSSSNTAYAYVNLTTDTNWHHIVVQLGAAGVEIYLDGVSQTVTNSNTGTGSNTSWISFPNYTGTIVTQIGKSREVTPQWSDGLQDQTRFFNRALTSTEVTTLYNEIQCANTITAPENYFQTKLYTGTGSSQNITGLNFAPEFVWIKDRSAGNWNNLQDTLRGATKHVYSNANNAQDTTSDGLTSFNSDGFTIGGGGGFGNNGNNFVSWNWKAGGTTESGTGNHYINVQKSVADEAGFSIVRFDFPFTPGGNALVPTDASYNHGLSKKPDLIITKAYSGYLGQANWYTWASPLGAGSNGLTLDSNAGTGSGYFGTIDSTKAEFRFSSNNINGLSGVVTYNFRNIDGYQRIGSYVGNANKTRIYTGFEPAWLLVKSLSSTNTWWIVDNKRDTANPRKQVLKPSSSSAETTETTNVIFHTNGFEFPNGNSDTNENNYTYLFWAIAANPDTSAPSKANSFNIKLYTGNDSNDRDITGLGFKPDFLWIKRRGTEPHALYDSVRGPNLQLTTHNTDAEATNSGSYLGMSSFDADGFNVGNNGGTNRAPHDYVAWAWKGLDHDRNLPAINNDGSISSSVSANIAAGFSIVSYRGNATSGATVGHGLGGELDFLIVKSTNLTQAWNVYVKGVTDTNAKYLRLNEPNNIYSTSNPRFIVGNFNDNVFSIGSDNACNGNNDEYIAYCFRSISGYSKVGTYTGAGSSGKTVTTGFQPRFILIKRIDDSSNNTSWAIYDSARGGTKPIRPNTSGDETSASTTEISFTSTGISIPTSSTSGLINESGDTYIYLAIA